MISASTYQSGVMPNSSPFSGHAVHSSNVPTTRGGSAQQITEHWADQLRKHKESERAHLSNEGQGHFYARSRATENKGIPAGPSTPGGSAPSADGGEDRTRPYSVEKSSERQYWHNLDMSGQGLRNITPKLFIYEFLHELFISSNRLTSLPAGIGELRHLQRLEASHNLIGSLPPEIGMCTALRELLLFDNRLQDLPNEMGSLHLLEMLGIEGNPHFNPRLRDKVMEEGTKALITMLREQAPVPMPPPRRESIVIQEDVSSSLERVKAMSWNILCEKYATEAQFGYAPSAALAWEHRKGIILEEIITRDADFLCLQEIASDVFNDSFSPELTKNGYRGIHFARSKAKIAGMDSGAVDGCAIFFKPAKWILLAKECLDYVKLSINRPDMKNQNDIFNRVMPKDNIGMVAFFESRATGARIIVANTHLAWEPTLADVKLVQSAILMENVGRLAEEWVKRKPLSIKEKQMILMPSSLLEEGQEAPAVPDFAPSQEYRNNNDIPLVVCGDFNSTRTSSVYELFTKGRVAPDHSDFGKYQYGNLTRTGPQHTFSMRSAYVHLEGTPDELTFTNYTPTFVDVIDYIWYSTNTLEVVELLGPPDPEYLKRVPGFPNWHFPADHIQLIADFVIKPRKDKKIKAEPDFGSSSNDRSRN